MSPQTSPDHSQVVSFFSHAAILRTVISLHRRRIRDAHGLCWVEGPRACLAAERQGWISKAYVFCRKLSTTPAVQSMLQRVRDGDCPIVPVDADRYRALSRTTRASGIGVVLKQRWTPLRDLNIAAHQTLLIAEQIRSNGNLGTILRTAEATGAGALILIGPDIDPFDPHLIRSSMGAVFSVPLVRTSVSRLQRWLTAHNVRCTALSPAGTPYWDRHDDGRPTALLIGEERRGLSDSLLSLTEETVSLPMLGDTDSLNVAVATGVMLYELTRRRQSSHSHDPLQGRVTTPEGCI